MTECFVETGLGRLRGVRRSSVDAFLGIRFGIAPQGRDRFTAPRPAPGWTGTYDATQFGMRPVEPAPANASIAGAGRVGDQSEDCLFLNVYAPHAATTGDAPPVPVLVWIHGGGFQSGSGNDFDPSALVTSGDVIVVTVNYRLGLLGFLDLSSFGDRYGGSACNGIRDLVLALQWIQEHIAAFGGDPANVTIFGESAGGGAVFALLGAPSADGLFHRAIPMSPGGVTGRPVDHVSRLTEILDVQRERVLEILLDASTSELLDLQARVEHTPAAVDGEVVTRPAPEAIRARGERGVPVLAGYTRDEGLTRVFLLEAGGETADLSYPYFEMFASWTLDGADATEYLRDLRDENKNLSEREVAGRVVTDYFRRQSTEMAEAATEAGPGGWVYRFDVECPFQNGVLRAGHGTDIPFTFNDVRGGPYEFVWRDPDDTAAVELARLWSSMLIAFARTGDPQIASLPAWSQYDTAERACLLFDAEPAVASDPDPDAQCRMLRKRHATSSAWA